MREFYFFKVQLRASKETLLLQGCQLFQQFVVDYYAAIKHNTLNYFGKVIAGHIIFFLS